MEGTQPDNVIVALDVGASKIKVAVAELSENGVFNVIGIGKVPSLGISTGCVQDVELAVESIRHAIEEAHETSRQPITHVVAALTGKHLHCVNKIGRLVLAGGEVDEADVKAATQLAMLFDPKTHDTETPAEFKHEDDRVVMHSLKGFTIDNNETLISDPVGMVGSVLKAHVHLAIGSDSIALNLVKCIRRAGLDLDGLVMQPWASAASCLTPTEKELGVVLLDFGAGATDIACYSASQVQYTAVAPVGSDILSRDIAACIGCSLDDAEDIKLSYGHIGEQEGDQYSRIRYTHEATGMDREISCRELLGIIEPRASEILQWLGANYLARDGWCSRAASGFVVTGGLVKLPGFVELIQRTFGLPVRIGAPAVVKTSMFNLTDPEDATLRGVLTETARHRSMGEHTKLRTSSGMFGWMRRTVFGDFCD